MHRPATDDAQRDLGPHRADVELVPLPSPPCEHEAQDDPCTGEEGEQPAPPVAERALGPAAEPLERLVERRKRLPLLAPHAEDAAAPDEEAAERDDERRNARVRDEESLRPSPRPRRAARPNRIAKIQT